MLAQMCIIHVMYILTGSRKSISVEETWTDLQQGDTHALNIGHVDNLETTFMVYIYRNSEIFSSVSTAKMQHRHA